jgi:serine/threonine protein kinase
MYIFMEFCEGGDLFDYIQKRSFGGVQCPSSFQVSNSEKLLIIGLGKKVVLNQHEKVKALCLTN